jgi:hypothetical protein
MTQTINMTMPTSLFIPRVVRSTADKCFTEVFLAIAFQQQRVAQVSRVDIVRNKTSPEWYSAFVHIDKWYSSSKGRAIRTKLTEAINGRLYYAPNKYWVLCQNTSALKTIPPPSKLKRSPPRP